MYKITTRVMALVTALIEEGYKGEAKITNSYALGAADAIGGQGVFSIELSGFCKETLCIVEDTDSGDIRFIGRYNTELVLAEPTTKDIVSLAWTMYQIYKAREYPLPDAFLSLFIKEGFIKQKTVTKTVYEET